jgi:RNA polymerase sigma-70 factor (ECF subfamily)
MARETPLIPPGEEAAIEARWQALVEEYGRFLRRTIVRLCPRDMGLDFDDIEQEARLRLWHALRNEREITSPASYLYRIAATATVDAIRRVKARREEPLSLPGDDDAAPEAQRELASLVDTVDGADRRLLVRQVEEALCRLPASRRRAVGLHLQGYTTAEIGQLLEWSEPKARNLVYRGLAELRERLREAGVDYESD